jgi:hypothetical protein
MPRRRYCHVHPETALICPRCIASKRRKPATPERVRFLRLIAHLPKRRKTSARPSA